MTFYNIVQRRYTAKKRLYSLTPVAVTPNRPSTTSSKSLLSVPPLGADVNCWNCALALLTPSFTSTSPKSTTSVNSTPPTVVTTAKKPAKAKMLKFRDPVHKPHSWLQYICYRRDACTMQQQCQLSAAAGMPCFCLTSAQWWPPVSLIQNNAAMSVQTVTHPEACLIFYLAFNSCISQQCMFLHLFLSLHQDTNRQAVVKTQSSCQGCSICSDVLGLKPWC